MRGQRQPDTIAAQLEHDLLREIKKAKLDLLAKVREMNSYQELIRSSRGAKNADNERLAHALVEAKLNNQSAVPIVDAYAQQFIYPYRAKQI